MNQTIIAYFVLLAIIPAGIYSMAGYFGASLAVLCIIIIFGSLYSMIAPNSHSNEI